MSTPMKPVVSHGFADVNGVRLHFAEAGEGPLVILLHGFPDFWYTWRHQIPVLAAAGYRVVAPDMRGYNLSAKPDGVAAYRSDLLARDVAELIRHLGEERASVVGHDWGGGVAWLFANNHPERLHRLAILNLPHPQRMMAGLKTVRQLLRSWYMFLFQVPWLPEALTSMGNYWLLRRVFRTDPARPGAFTEEEIARHVEAAAQPGALTAMINYYRALFRESPAQVAASLRTIQAPVLVVWGDQDRYLGKELAEPDPQWVPDCRVVHFPGASHWVQHDEPEAVSRLLVDFFRAP